MMKNKVFSVLIAVALLLLVSVILYSLFSVKKRMNAYQRFDLPQKEVNRPIRGCITDCNGLVLAQTRKRYAVCADPSILAESAELHLLSDLAKLIGVDQREIIRSLQDIRKRYVRLASDLSLDTVNSVRSLDIRGVFVEDVLVREYPQRTPMSHLVGFVQAHNDLQGGGGIEMTQNTALTDGARVTLTLDVELQRSVHRLAEKAALETRAKQVQIIVADPETGAISAAVQFPAVHSGESKRPEMKALWWRAAVDVFEPGGLLKPLVMASALEGSFLTSNTVVNCHTGVLVHCGVSLRDATPFVELLPSEVIVRSSNIGVAQVGLLMKKQGLYDSLVNWKLCEKCDAGVSGATAGLLRPPDKWSKVDLTRIPIGHGCSFSLLQIVRAYTALFNDGCIVEPHLIANIPPELTPLLSARTTRYIKESLEDAVTKGRGRRAALEGVVVAGKTAVAQKFIVEDGKYSNEKVETSFVGGFESGGTQYLIAVWIDEPQRDKNDNPATRIFQEAAQLLVAE